MPNTNRTPRHLTLGVLAGAYRGGRTNLKATLTHVIADGAEKTICGRIDADHMADEFSGADTNAPATCPRLREARSAEGGGVMLTNGMHVGKVVWVFQADRRVYHRDPVTGHSKGGPIWREHWVEQVVLGETRVSWLIGPAAWKGSATLDRDCRKLKKAEGKWSGVALTPKELDDRELVHRNAYRVGEAVGRCADAETLRTIAKMVGYPLLPPERIETGESLEG